MTLLRVRGIPIRLHWSFLLLAGFFVLARALGGGLPAALEAAVVGLFVFGSVALHELGHALAARAYGIPTRDITLYPFGGIASLLREPRSPAQELVIAAAGPAVNALLALLGAGLWLLGVPEAGLFAVVNLGMGLFNLIPAFPMDGGRVLRAWWTPRLGPVVATLRSLDVARWFGWGFVVLGLFTSANLLMVGGFLLLVNGAERRRWQAVAQRTPVHSGRPAVSVRHWRGWVEPSDHHCSSHRFGHPVA